MSISADVLKRVRVVAEADQVVVVPIGEADDGERGILGLSGTRWGGLRRAVVAAVGAALVAAALSQQEALAGGVGYDAGAYGQAEGQVMQQGSGTRMQVISVRPVDVEVALAPDRGEAALGYAAPPAGAAIGAIIGNRSMAGSPTGQQIGTILGGLAGGVVGAKVNDAMKGSRAKVIRGTEITMVNPVTRNIAVVTQAGEQRFGEGDAVIVLQTAGSTRVIADRSAAHAMGRSTAGQAVTPSGAAFDVVRAGVAAGVRVDPGQVSAMLDGARPADQSCTGRIVEVDRERGLVYQELGRGEGMVHTTQRLSRTPAVGDVVRVTYRFGLGEVEGRSIARGGLGR